MCLDSLPVRRSIQVVHGINFQTMFTGAAYSDVVDIKSSKHNRLLTTEQFIGAPERRRPVGSVVFSVEDESDDRALIF